MKLIKPSFEIIDQEPGFDGMLKHIELCGRVCYKSTSLYRWYSKDKTRWLNENSEEWKFLENPKEEYPIRGENISTKDFTDRIIKSGHWAVLEHGTVYLKLTPSEIHIYHKYMSNPYTKTNKVNSKAPYPVPTYYISTNYRVLIEQDWLDDLKYFCEPTKFHEKRVTVKFICDRGVSHELVRHRTINKLVA